MALPVRMALASASGFRGSPIATLRFSKASVAAARSLSSSARQPCVSLPREDVVGGVGERGHALGRDPDMTDIPLEARHQQTAAVAELYGDLTEGAVGIEADHALVGAAGLFRRKCLHGPRPPDLLDFLPGDPRAGQAVAGRGFGACRVVYGHALPHPAGERADVDRAPDARRQRRVQPREHLLASRL